MIEDKKNPENQNSIQMNVDQDKIESKYTDAVFINFNPFGYSFDFAQSVPQLKMFKIIQRVSMSPQHAKALVQALQNQVLAYEKQFGEITLTAAMQEQANKQPIGFDTK